MKAQQLKNSILQYAMKGKLVEQDPNDESASVLLEKIKEEKEQLIKDKVIKREKRYAPILDDEIPFDIPNSWKWIRLGEIGKWGAGATPSRSNPSYYGEGIPWLKTGELTDGLITESDESITQLALEETSVKLNPIGSVLIAMYGATIGKLGILSFEATTNQACCACIPFPGVYNKFLFYYLMSERKTFISSAEGGAQPNISRTKIVNFRFPLPPISEQQRVVDKIEELFEKVNQYNIVEKEITSLNNSFPTDMEKSILQYAMQGKLVSQDPNDELASMLLEKIKEEKEQLIKDKVIMREKALPITDDEIPFEIPDTWEWVRLNDLSSKVHYGYTASASDKGNAKLLRITDIQNNRVEWNTVPYCEISENKLSSYELESRDILIARTGGTIGKSYIINQVHDTSVFASYLIRVKPLKNITANYFKIFLESPLYWTQLEKMSVGTGQPNVNATNLKKLILPLPPLEEQQRIVDKIDEMVELTNRLKNSISN